MSKGKQSETYEELVQQEKELTEEKNKKLAQRDAQRLQINEIEKREGALQRLMLTLETKIHKQEQDLTIMEGEQEKKMDNEKNDHNRQLQEKKKEIEQFRVPRDEARSNLELIESRIEYIRETWEQKKSQVMKEIKQAKYLQQLIRARSRDVSSRIELMKAFLREHHPEVKIEEDELSRQQRMLSRTVAQELAERQSRGLAKALEDECRRLYEARGQLKDDVEKLTKT